MWRCSPSIECRRSFFLNNAYITGVCIDISGAYAKLVVNGNEVTFYGYSDETCESDELAVGSVTADGSCDSEDFLAYTVLSNSDAYTVPQGGLTDAYFGGSDCDSAPAQYLQVGIAGCMMSMDDEGNVEGSVAIAYTSDGCTLDSFTSQDCSGSAAATQTITNGQCIANSQEVDFLEGIFTSEGEALYCTAAGTSSDSDDVCFAGSETVLLESGLSIAMENVMVGDRIQVASTDGSLEFSEVIFVPHEKNSQRSVFVELETARSSLKVTPTHLVLAGECGSNMALTRAEEVTVGSCLAGVSGEEAVTASSRTSADGVYSVITSHSDGIIVVNGFKASSFALNHAVGNTYYQIHRALYHVAPGIVGALSGLGSFLGSVVVSAVSA